MPRIVERAGQRLEVAGIGELVDRDDVIVAVGDELAYQSRTDESGAAGYEIGRQRFTPQVEIHTNSVRALDRSLRSGYSKSSAPTSVASQDRSGSPRCRRCDKAPLTRGVAALRHAFTRARARAQHCGTRRNVMFAPH